jgi:pyruvate dehydrogenase E2 component (dihydrolipoamide acetyltransferase)
VSQDICIPDIGGADAVEVIEILVAPGQTVAADDPIIVIESDKATMEVPAGVAGVIEALTVVVGDQVREGQVIARLAAAAFEADAPAKAGASAQPVAAAEPAAPAPETEPAAPAPETGPAQPAAASSPASSPAPSPPQAGGPPVSRARAQVAALLADAERAVAEGPRNVNVPDEPRPAVYAGPAVRRLARELGVALDAVAASGLRGRIVKDDVKAFVKQQLTQPPVAATGGGLPTLPAVDFSRFGPIETVPLSRIRARGADNLHRSWVNIPHVTQHDDADVTDLESFRKALKAEAERRGVKLTLLPFLIKACCQALAEFPVFNASLDPEARNFIMKGYCNVGIAVDTDDGLLVPVIRDANQKGIWTLAAEAAALADKARQRKLGPNDMQGGTFSISSLGALGGTGFTPIINAPEVAILGVARLTRRPVWDGAAFAPRDCLPLSLSYDHRAINGAEAARFMSRLTELLGDIRRLVL